MNCPSCGGTGKCKWCAPKGSGSGKNSDGNQCVMCNGTGKCKEPTSAGERCHGTGEIIGPP